jgi:hypothetical protein
MYGLQPPVSFLHGTHPPCGPAAGQAGNAREISNEAGKKIALVATRVALRREGDSRSRCWSGVSTYEAFVSQPQA